MASRAPSPALFWIKWESQLRPYLPNHASAVAMKTRALPRRLHFKHGRYFRVAKGKWTPLSKDYGEALRMFAELEAPTRGAGLDDLVDRIMADYRKKSAASTIKTFEICAVRIKEAFAEFDAGQVKPTDVAQFLDDYADTPGMANHARTVLNAVFKRAVRLGLSDTNPVAFVEPLPTKKRDRYITDGELIALRDNASPTMRAMIDIAYLTGQRVGDIRHIRYSDITDEGVYFKQQKTGNRVLVAMSEDLRAAVAQARVLHQSVKGLTLFHTRRGTPISYSTVRTLWLRAVTRAGIADVHFHDLRAKAATDSKAQGGNSKALLGHTTETSHNRYLRGRETTRAEPVRLKKS